MSVAITLTVFCTGIVIVSMLGGVVPLAVMLNHTRLQVYLSFSAGAMLGAAFFHMMPEAVRVGSPETLYWTALGLLALFFLERFFSYHHHEAREPHPAPNHAGQHSRAGHSPPSLAAGVSGSPDDSHHSHSHSSATMRWAPAAIGLAVHSLVGGIALASAVAADFEVGRGALGAGLGVFVATLVHKPADALTITALMLESGSPRRYAHAVNLAFALMIPVGVALFWVGPRSILPLSPGSWTSAALAFSAGTFLCIALSDLLPELQFHSHDRLALSVALLAGFALVAAAAVAEPSPREEHPPHPAQAVVRP
jgi:zinc and cadmium transporter